jgi:hypothetical protein
MRRAAAPALLVVALVPAACSHAPKVDVPNGPEVDVSNLRGAQAEATVTVDPSNPKILLAGSNSIKEGTMRAYSSVDGGRTWRGSVVYQPPSHSRLRCAADPGVAIDRRGRQYFSFVSSAPCFRGPPHLYVTSRAGPSAHWGPPTLVAPLGGARADDKPWLTVDDSPDSPYRNRVYVVWSRIARTTRLTILASHSDDGGVHWSPPLTVNGTGDDVSFATVVMSRHGTVYVAWDDRSNFAVKIARSTDGGAHFGPEQVVATFAIVTIPHCGSGIPIPALRLNCVQANPEVSVDTSGGAYSGRVYVTYAATDFQGDQGVHVAAFDGALRPLFGSTQETQSRAIAREPPSTYADQFLPASAVDPATGAMWVCWYDTAPDPNRKRAFYTCAFSTDGGRTFTKPAHAASVASDETGGGADSRGYGDYENVAAAGGRAHPIWTDSRRLATLEEEIYTTTLAQAGSIK